MRKNKTLLSIVVIILVLLASCATVENDATVVNTATAENSATVDVSKSVSAKTNNDGSPAWTSKIPTSSKMLYGVGKAKLMTSSNSQQAADAMARSDLALKISTNLNSALTVYSNEASTVVITAYETIIKQSVNLTMKKVVVEQRWVENDGTVWTLVSFKIKDLPALYEDAANDYLNQLEERRISTANKLATLLKELGDSSDEDVLTLRQLAQQKAESIIAEVSEISGSIDIPTQKDELSQYLLEEGFDLSE